MKRFDFNKIIDSKHQNHGLPNYFCVIRKKLIVATQEEKVRQSAVQFLMEDLKIPFSLIDVEVHLNKFCKNAKMRADIIVYKDKDWLHPYIVIECKAGNVALTDNVNKQILQYNEKLNAPYLCITNGNYIEIIEVKTNRSLEDLNGIFDLNAPLDYSNTLMDDWTWERVKEADFRKDSYISHLCEKINKTPTFPKYRLLYNKKSSLTTIRIASKLMDLFFDTTKGNSVKNLTGQQFNLLEDGGVRFAKFGAFGGYTFNEFYRYFIITDLNKNSKTISLSIFSYNILDIETQEIRESSYSGTYLVVGIDSGNSSAHSLELKIDKYSKVNSDIVNIIHDGAITVRKRIPNQILLDFVKMKQPTLVSNNKIILGQFDLTSELLFSQRNVRNLISNLIDYSLLRQDLREQERLSRD